MESTATVTKGSQIVKTIYFYLVSFVALLMIVIPAANLINLGVRHLVFQVGSYENYYAPRAVPLGEEKVPQFDPAEEKRRYEEQQKNQLKRDIARDISFLIVGISLFIFNWKLIRRNKFSA